VLRDFVRETIQGSQLNRVDAGSNTSTVALRIAGGDEKGTLFLKNINTGTWPSRLGESRI
jgi:hypothetical protein